MGKKELGNNNLLMRLNKRIGSRNVITAIAATVFIIIFLKFFNIWYSVQAAVLYIQCNFGHFK